MVHPERAPAHLTTKGAPWLEDVKGAQNDLQDKREQGARGGRWTAATPTPKMIPKLLALAQASEHKTVSS